MLALLGTGGVGIVAGTVGYRALGREPTNGRKPVVTPEPTPTDTPRGTPTPDSGETETPDQKTPDEGTPEPEGESILDYGAAVDGKTDDTEAIMAALEAAGSDGTVRLPAGNILISGFGHEKNRAIELTGDYSDVTIVGAGSGTGGTTLVMAGGHGAPHFGIYISGRAGGGDGVTLEGFRMLGQGLEQEYQIGIGIEVNGDGERPVTVRDLVVEDWGVNGLNTRSPGTHIVDSTFRRNGRKAREAGIRGHGVYVDVKAAGTETLAERVIAEENTGNGFNSNDSELTIRNCIVRNNQLAIKLDENTERVTIENTLLLNHPGPPIHNIPENTDTGVLVLENVLIRNSGWPGLHLPAGGTLRGDNIAIVDTNKDQRQFKTAGMMLLDEGKQVDIGRLSVHGTAGGSALYFENSSGRIDSLVQENEKGVGETSDVEIGSVSSGPPLSIAVPRAADIGAFGERP